MLVFPGGEVRSPSWCRHSLVGEDGLRQVLLVPGHFQELWCIFWDGFALAVVCAGHKAEPG